MVEIRVDGRPLAVTPGVRVLEALRGNGIELPALCYHPHLGTTGNCGLCMVEIKAADNWKPQHACLVKVTNGMEIKTATQRLTVLRSWAAQILLRKGPFTNSDVEELLVKLADNKPEKQKSANLEKDIQTLSGNSMQGCILCGLCIRVCSKTGKNRLTFLGRGKNLSIGLVKSSPTSCGNCHACRNVCPAGFITSDGEHTFRAQLYKE